MATTRRQFLIKKERIRLYRTVEIYHPAIGVLRYVDGTIDPKFFTLEATAPRNAGQTVEFIGAGMRYTLPDQSDDNGTLEVQLGRVGSPVKQLLKQVVGFTRIQTGEVIIREYIDGATDGPFVLQLGLASVTITPDGVAILAELENPAIRAVSEIYTVERFPGLAKGI